MICKMAKPILETPTLKGKDAERFYQLLNSTIKDRPLLKDEIEIKKGLKKLPKSLKIRENKIIKVYFRLAKTFPMEVRKTLKAKDNDFIELKIVNPNNPTIELEKIGSSVKKLKEILKKEKVKVKL